MAITANSIQSTLHILAHIVNELTTFDGRCKDCPWTDRNFPPSNVRPKATSSPSIFGIPRDNAKQGNPRLCERTCLHSMCVNMLFSCHCAIGFPPLNRPQSPCPGCPLVWEKCTYVCSFVFIQDLPSCCTMTQSVLSLCTSKRVFWWFGLEARRN